MMLSQRKWSVATYDQSGRMVSIRRVRRPTQFEATSARHVLDLGIIDGDLSAFYWMPIIHCNTASPL